MHRHWATYLTSVSPVCPLRDIADATVTISQPRADLAVVKQLVEKTLTPVIDPVQLTAVYRLHYLNRGPDPAPDVRLIDILPSGMVIDQPPSLPFDGINIPQLTWALGTLQPGDSGEITMTVRLEQAIQGKVLTNIASISCGCTDPDSSNDEDAASLTVSQNIVSQNIPTAIALKSFQIDMIEEGVEISWTTLAEHNTMGFQLYRSMSNDLNSAVSLMPSMIPSQGIAGGDYRFIDQSVLSDAIYIYWLLETELSGVQNVYGPVQGLILAQRASTPQPQQVPQIPPLSTNQHALYLPVIIQ